MKIVALEEHFATAEVLRGWKSVDPRWSDRALKLSTEGEGARRLLDLGAERLKAMDEAGIDVAVLSLTSLGVQNLNAEVAVDLALSSNDQLAAAVQTTSERFQGFAALPTPSPEHAAKELARCIQGTWPARRHVAWPHARPESRVNRSFGQSSKRVKRCEPTLPAPRNRRSRACWTLTTKGSARISTLCLQAQGLAGITKPEFRSSA